jgi:hypothetical protein
MTTKRIHDANVSIDRNATIYLSLLFRYFVQLTADVAVTSAVILTDIRLPFGTLLGANAIAAATIARKAMIWNDFMVTLAILLLLR